MKERQFVTPKRVARPIDKRLVILTPMPEHQAVLVAVLGAGSAVIFPKGTPRIADLVLAKVPAVLAGILTNTLRQVFQE